MTFAPLSQVAPTVGAKPAAGVGSDEEDWKAPRMRSSGRRRPAGARVLNLAPPRPISLPSSPSRNPVAFFGLAGVAYISIPRILNSRHADDMPTLARDWKREEAKRFLNYEREGAPGAPVVLNPISKGM